MEIEGNQRRVATHFGDAENGENGRSIEHAVVHNLDRHDPLQTNPRLQELDVRGDREEPVERPDRVVPAAGQEKVDEDQPHEREIDG
jgi:hypothetical protein